MYHAHNIACDLEQDKYLLQNQKKTLVFSLYIVFLIPRLLSNKPC
jgi:hypothetical protein